ncbi:hypothetical protein [Veronia pacifica]|uniref:Uncharacterized protein n=1 Tax=Veronia pacifica TaxID=1080227 RepID=A0A1C3EGB5_9GAMM|nr:hypothetical protein [Veronia pacifica]ODA32259.1 hypothetical protein A8L45_13790 [Veronia pacifica]
MKNKRQLLNKVLTLLMCISAASFFSVASAADCDQEKVTMDGQLQNLAPFPSDSWDQPLTSYFKIVTGTLMSNECGQRFALLKVKNTDSIRHVFEEGHIMAVMADQTVRYPHSFRKVMDAREEITLSVNFGKSKMPILSIYTRGKG